MEFITSKPTYPAEDALLGILSRVDTFLARLVALLNTFAFDTLEGDSGSLLSVWMAFEVVAGRI